VKNPLPDAVPLRIDLGNLDPIARPLPQPDFVTCIPRQSGQRPLVCWFRRVDIAPASARPDSTTVPLRPVFPATGRFIDAVITATTHGRKTPRQKVCRCAGENLVGWTKGNSDAGDF